MKRVLVVCTGNICRSPMGEQILREAAASEGIALEVDSAGISSEEEGNPIDRRAAGALERGGHGVPRSHRARQVEPGELARWDLVLAMTAHHLGALRRRAELDGAETSTIRMWREFDPEAPTLASGAREADLDIEDPWYGPARGFDTTLAQLEAGVPAILAELATNPETDPETDPATAG